MNNYKLMLTCIDSQLTKKPGKRTWVDLAKVQSPAELP